MTRVLVVQHQDDCPPALVGDWLREAGCELDVRHPYAGEHLPADLVGHDALLVMGGSMGANDDATNPWLTPTKALVRDAAARRTPALGICLGHQLVAVSLGGTSSRNPAGKQLGLLDLGWTDAADEDEVFRDATGAQVGVFWNDDVITETPPGTQVLARTPAGELQVARFAPSVWGVQLHPEVDEGGLARWAEEDRTRHEEGVLDRVLDRVAARRDDLERGWRPLATAFARRAASPR